MSTSLEARDEHGPNPGTSAVLVVGLPVRRSAALGTVRVGGVEFERVPRLDADLESEAVVLDRTVAV